MFYFVNRWVPNYTKLHVIVYIKKGNHFFIQCDDKVAVDDDDELRSNVLCSLDSLQKIMPRSDNV